MMHLYEIESHGINWDIYDEKYDYLDTITEESLPDSLDYLRELGVDFVLHTLKEYDEYHLALPSKQTS
jgi:hypothetical protein